MKKTLFIAVTALLAYLSIPAPALAKTLEELLVEKGLITKADAAATTGTERAKVYWKDGTRIEFPDSGFTSGISVFLQERYTYSDEDKEADNENSSSFEINKARLKIAGSALHKEFEYLLQSEFAGSEGAELLDASLKWNANDWSSLRMG